MSTKHYLLITFTAFPGAELISLHLKMKKNNNEILRDFFIRVLNQNLPVVVTVGGSVGGSRWCWGWVVRPPVLWTPPHTFPVRQTKCKLQRSLFCHMINSILHWPRTTSSLALYDLFNVCVCVYVCVFLCLLHIVYQQSEDILQLQRPVWGLGVRL